MVDADRVVSRITLLDEELSFAVPSTDEAVRLPTGQVELVATLPEYEGRGLVRALMGWAHQRSAARGHLVQLMVGIPYFYRIFGYSYAIDIAPWREARSVLTTRSDITVRAAEVADLPAVQALQDQTQSRVDLRMPHSPSCWRWLLARDGSTTVVAVRDGIVVGSGRTTPPEGGVGLGEVAAQDHAVAAALVTHAAALGGSEPLQLADRPGTAFGALVDEIADLPRPGAQKYYLRIPDLVALLDALRPVLEARLAGAEVDPSAEILLSTFGAHVRMPVRDGRLDHPVGGGTLQSPHAAGGAGVAPDRVPELLFGGLGIRGLIERYPDVYPGPHRELMEALFPPVSSDVMTFYLP
ncbi:MAG: GNAT family N-acetyltransferase [Jatrophihabitans sp.]